MRILKYLLLLVLLLLIGTAVFVATQKGAFGVRQTRVVRASRASAFAYVNDFRNWPAWFSPADKPHFPAVTSGRGGSFSWDGDQGEGSLRTNFAKENDSLAQTADWGGFPGHVSWKFRDKGLNQTEITVTASGKFGFGQKIRSTLSGGPQEKMATIFENGMENLDRHLIKETGTYKIEVAGEVVKTGAYYLRQSITSTIAEMPRNQRIMRSNLTYFFTKNNLRLYGKPFVLYDFYDPAHKLTRFSFGMPIRQQAFTMPGSDISSGRLEPFRAVKVTLTGDYSHLAEAYAKADAFIRDNHLHKSGTAALEWYRVGKENGKSPSQWVTDVYIPVGTPIVAVAKARPAPRPQQPPQPSQPETEEISIP